MCYLREFLHKSSDWCGTSWNLNLSKSGNTVWHQHYSTTNKLPILPQNLYTLGYTGRVDTATVREFHYCAIHKQWQWKTRQTNKQKQQHQKSGNDGQRGLSPRGLRPSSLWTTYVRSSPQLTTHLRSFRSLCPGWRRSSGRRSAQATGRGSGRPCKRSPGACGYERQADRAAWPGGPVQRQGADHRREEQHTLS